MSNKKSQATMEFLMTYGWAILVVLVAIGGLMYFGVLSPDKFLPSCVCSDLNMSYVKSITIDNLRYLECSKSEIEIYRNIVDNSESIEEASINYVFICDEEEGVLIPYKDYRKELEEENA